MPNYKSVGGKIEVVENPNVVQDNIKKEREEKQTLEDLIKKYGIPKEEKEEKVAKGSDKKEGK